MKKYEYEDEKCTRANICYGGGIFIILSWYISQISMNNLHLKNLILHIPVWIGALIFFLAGRRLSQNAIEKRKEHERIKKYGQSYTGKVIKINVTQNIDKTQSSYTLDVSYYSALQGKEIIFTTPFVTFTPKEHDHITCTVYEYKDTRIAESFQGYTRKTIWDKISTALLCILIIATMFGVYYLLIPFWD